MSLRRPAHRALIIGAALAVAGAAAAQTVAQQVVVSATRHLMALADAPAAMTVITREQMERRGADNLFDALRGETGVAVFGRTTGGRKSLSLRGTEGRHVLVLVDGRRVSASEGVIGHSDFQFDWVTTLDVERIEVVRGPMSVLYGADALGGVVNIITRAPGGEPHVQLLAEGARADGGRGGGGHRAQARLDLTPAPGLQLALTAADARREVLATPADPRLSDLEGRRKQDLALRAAWQPAAAHRLEAEHLAGDEERVAFARERTGARRYYASVTPIERRHSALAWSAEWGGAVYGRSQLRAYRSTLQATNVRTAGVAPLRPNGLADEVVDAQASFITAPGQLTTLGNEWRKEALRNEGLPGASAQADHRSLFGQHEASLRRDLDLTVGLRHDRHQRFGSVLNPRAYVVWRAAPGWAVKAGAGRGFKPPTLKQITDGYQEDEGPNTYFGNPRVRPESSRSAEVGAAWSAADFGVQALAFRNRVSDLIVPRLLNVVAGRGQYRFDNIEQARLQGLEASLSAKLGAGLMLAANYHYLDARDERGQRLERRPRHALGTTLEWRSGRWLTTLRGEHSAGMRLATGVVGQAPQSVPDLTQWHASLAYEFDKRFTLAAHIDNLTDLRLADESPLYTYAELPRMARVVLRASW
jgi:outer membrane receptor for ferrienterochelin and colicins